MIARFMFLQIGCDRIGMRAVSTVGRSLDRNGQEMVEFREFLSLALLPQNSTFVSASIP
jgi:hypothetical protein